MRYVSTAALGYLAVVVFCTEGFTQEVPDLQFGEAHLRTMAVGAEEITYLDKGEGAPILAFHPGIGYLWWQFFIDEASKSHRVVSPDPFTFDVEQLFELWESLDLEPVHLVGHSIGGWIAIQLADAHPDMVRSIVLLEPGYAPTMESARAQAAAMETAGVTCRLTEPAERQACELVNALSGPGYFETAPESLRMLILSQDRNVAQVLARAPPLPTEEAPEGWQFPFPPICEMAERLSVPLLFVRGRGGPPASQVGLDAHEACLPDHETAYISEAAHNAHMDHSEEFNSVVLEFVGRQ